MKRIIFSLLLSIVLSSFGFAQEEVHQHHAGCSHGLIALDEDANTFVPPPASYVPGADRAVVISVTYNGFTAPAQEAFQYAVDIWASTLTSNVPILVTANFTNLGAGVLGSAGATNYYRNFTNAPLSNIYYPVALANSLRNSDLGFGIADITANFSSTFNWYYGTDGNCPSGQYDFVSVVLHELCHGLGFVGSASYDGVNGFIGFGGSPVIYDVFVENSGGTNITTFSNGSSTLGSQLTGNALYWNGTQGLAANSGIRPRLYAPSSWNGGSSYSHLNESTYPSGNINSLMTPQIAAAEAIHDPGPIVLGMFEDMGWAVDNTNCEIISVSAGTQTDCNPITGLYTQQLTITYAEPPSTGNLVVNGQPFPITGSPQTVTLTALTANGNSQNAVVSFSENGGCINSFTNVWTAPVSCCTELRLTNINPSTKRITITNLAQCSVDSQPFQVSSGGLSSPLSGLAIVGGGNYLDPGETVTYQWNAWNPDPNGDDFSLFLPGGNVNSSADILDYVQWGDAGNTNENLAVSAGIWGAGDFVFDTPPYDFLGGAGDHGVEFWDFIVPPCSIVSIEAGVQSPCNGIDNTFTQEIIVTYSNEPSTGFLRVNNFDFPITGSPQSIVFTYPANGLSIDYTAKFSTLQSCILTENDLVTSPSPCSNCSIDAVIAGTQTPCSPVPQFYYQEITVFYSNPPQGGILINGQSFPIIGSPQTFELLGLSDGQTVDIDVSFSFDSNCSFSAPALYTAPLPCSPCAISNLSAGTQSSCNPGSNTYSQEIIVTYGSAPGTGTLDVNGESFAITGSPQTVLLPNLTSDGLTVDVSASFSSEPACNLTVNSLFVAPASCSASCFGDFNGDNQINSGDLNALLAQLGCSSNCTTDLNNDGNVNVGDLNALLVVFSTSCP